MYQSLYDQTNDNKSLLFQQDVDVSVDRAVQLTCWSLLSTSVIMMFWASPSAWPISVEWPWLMTFWMTPVAWLLLGISMFFWSTPWTAAVVMMELVDEGWVPISPDTCTWEKTPCTRFPFYLIQKLLCITLPLWAPNCTIVSDGQIAYTRIINMVESTQMILYSS